MQKGFKGGSACWMRSGTGTGFCFVLNSIFALKQSQLTGSGLCCLWIQEGSKMADGSAECLLLKLVLSGPSELGADYAAFGFMKVQRWQMAALSVLLKLVLSGPSELGAELSNCQDILPLLLSSLSTRAR